MASIALAMTTSLSVALPLAALAGDEPDAGTAAQNETTTTGEIVAVTDGSGHTSYVLRLADGTEIALSFGPSWFSGLFDPLDALVGTTVDVGGHVAVDGPNEHASATGQEHAANKPKLKVRSVDGTPLRSKGKPPWAGGPKVVGESHPGYAGWSKGQANKAAHQPDKPDQGDEAETEKDHGPEGD
jgi:hypothetical protein